MAASVQKNSVLRFITCGSVDDGKSTLIGRILYESGSIPEDQLAALEKDSQKFGTNGTAHDYALLVDGLAAEREQGITIDVAYRYFSTKKRGFIVADTPGHEQYTRNMATGASNAQLAILLVDARKGLLAQTRRHAFIVSLLGVKHVVVAINKMDLVGFDAAVFRAIEADFRSLAAELNFVSLTFIPVSAREGDNLVTPSPRTPWYQGHALLPFLETLEMPHKQGTDFVFPVQWVNRPNADFRGYSGTIAAGGVNVGDKITALPSGKNSVVTRLLTPQGERNHAASGEAITLTLRDEIDITRGDVLVRNDPTSPLASVKITETFEAKLIVTGHQIITEGAEFLLRIGSASANARLIKLSHAINIETYAPHPLAVLPLNGIGAVTLKLDRPLVMSDYTQNTDLGGFILIDRRTNETSAFGFVENLHHQQAGAIAPQATLFERFFGGKGSEKRQKCLYLFGWRFISASLLALIIGFWQKSLTLTALVFVIDLVLRSLLHYLYRQLWVNDAKKGDVTRTTSHPEKDSSLDGGGI